VKACRKSHKHAKDEKLNEFNWFSLIILRWFSPTRRDLGRFWGAAAAARQRKRREKRRR